MGFLDIFRLTKSQTPQTPKPKREKRHIGTSCIDLSHLNHLYTIGGGVQQSSLTLSAIYRCIDLISDQIAILPIRCNDEDTQYHISELFAGTYIGGVSNLIKQIMLDVLRSGNGYLYLRRDNNNIITKIYYLAPNSVTMSFDEQKQEVYYNIPHTITSKRVESINIIHLRKWSNDGRVGTSPLSYAQGSIKLAHSIEDSARDFFSGGLNLSGVLESPQQLSRQQREDLHQSWLGSYVRNKLAIIGGGLSYKPIQSTLSESQSNENRQTSVHDLARYFGVHPMLLGEVGGQIYDIETVSQLLVQYTLQPYITMIENELNKKLLTPSERRAGIRINLDESVLLRTNKINSANYYSTLLQSGVYNINEVRNELGLPQGDKELDRHIIAYTDIKQNTISQGDNDKNNE